MIMQNIILILATHKDKKQEIGFSNFSYWPDLIQINLLEKLSFPDTLKLRLVSRDWCTGVDYVRRIWSIHKPKWVLQNDNLYEYWKNNVCIDPLGVHQSLPPSSFLAFLVKCLNNEWRSLQFDEVYIGEGNTWENIRLFLNNSTKVQSLTLLGTCFSNAQSDSNALDDCCFQNCKELRIQITRGNRIQRSKIPDLALKQHFTNLSTFLTKATFPQLCKLHLQFYFIERHFTHADADGSIELALLCSVSMPKFLKSYGEQIEEFSIGFNSENLKYIVPIFKCLPNIKKFTFCYTSDTDFSVSTRTCNYINVSSPFIESDLIICWKKAVSEFKKLSHISLTLFVLYLANEKLLASLLASSGSTLKSLVVKPRLTDATWLNPSFCPKNLQYLELSIYDEVLQMYQNYSSVFSTISTLMLDVLIPSEDNGCWRNNICKWTAKLAPNLCKLIVKTYTHIENQYKMDACHVSNLVNELKRLVILKVHYRTDGVSSQSDLEEFCNNSQGQCFFKAYKQIPSDDSYPDVGFQVYIKRKQ